MTTGESKSESQRKAIEHERLQILDRLECWLETPMIILAFIWLALLIVEFARGQSRWLEISATTIWIVFIVDFLIRFTVAPVKLSYLRKNWLTAFSLIIPALRAFRIFAVLRFIRVARGLRLIRVLASINRGMRALGATMKRRGFGYVVLLTALVTFAGAAGMLAFEKNVTHPNGLHSYSGALWWTAMIMTTMGTDYWPQTLEGRMLCLLLALYAFAVFGYVTATIATFFIGRDAESDEGEIAGQNSMKELRAEIAALRAELQVRRENP